MATAVTDTTSTTPSSTSTTTATNPNANLDSQAFMKLLLTELQYQDPTEPMDSEKMLTQTSQLAALETQESTNKLMEKLTEQLKAQSTSGVNAYAISSIGKLATTGTTDVTVSGDSTTAKIDIYLANEVKEGKLIIKNSSGVQVASLDLTEGMKGTTSFSWDLKDNENARVDNGTYSVVAQYTGTDGESHEAKPGTYPIEAVKFVDGEAQVKIGSSYIPITNVKEFSQG